MLIDCLIPARAGSKGVPNKNIRDLAGHPLLTYSIAAAKMSKYKMRVYVTTDSENISLIAKKYGADAPYIRPASISGDDAIDLGFFLFHLSYLEKNKLPVPDFIVHLRPTTPVRDPEIIDAAIDAFIVDKNATALRSAHKSAQTPYKMFKKKGGYMQPFLSSDLAREFYNLPRQVFEQSYTPNGYVDIVKPSIFSKGEILHGENILLFETDEVSDIDSLSDLYQANTSLEGKRYEKLVTYLGKLND